MFDVIFYSRSSLVVFLKETLANSGENITLYLLKCDVLKAGLVNHNRELHIYSAYFIFRVINVLSESFAIARISTSKTINRHPDRGSQN